VSALEDAIEAARAGKLVVVPTDTVYGIGTRADDPAATARLIEAKGRPRELHLPVFVSSPDAARKVAVLDERAEKLARAFWPGPLTIVLPRRDASHGWVLGGDGASIGLRIPGHPLARALTEGVGALAATSANRSGEPVCTTCDEVEATFGDAVEVYLCEEQPLPSTASTVADLTGDQLRVLRPGAIEEADLKTALA